MGWEENHSGNFEIIWNWMSVNVPYINKIVGAATVVRKGKFIALTAHIRQFKILEINELKKPEEFQSKWEEGQIKIKRQIKRIF